LAPELLAAPGLKRPYKVLKRFLLCVVRMAKTKKPLSAVRDIKKVMAFPSNVLGPVPGVDVMAKRPQGLLNVGTLSARMAVLRSCALDI
jgi:hypothetical protein